MKVLVQRACMALLVSAGIFLIPSVANAATYIVTNTSDGGAGSLRQAIIDANSNAGADTIDFNIPGAGVHTLTPASPYDNITEQVTIDGLSQPGATCGTLVPATLPAVNNTPHNLLIEIDGTNTAGHILDVGGGAVSTIIRGLVMNNAQSSFILGVSADLITVECNYIGTNPSGTAAGSNNNTPGIAANNGGNNMVIQNNLISGNVGPGIYISGNEESSTLINNLIGTTANGLSALANTQGGVQAEFLSEITHNIISGNQGQGINIVSDGVNIKGNYIGLNLAGNPLGNSGEGILAGANSSNYQIGGTAAGEGNIISANTGNGIHIFNEKGVGCPLNTYSTTLGNLIGTNPSGNVQTGFGNMASGIQVNEVDGTDCVSSIYKHQIGGDGTGQANTIAGNATDGVRIFQYVDEVDPSASADVFSISVLKNSIYSNGNLGINLATDNNNDGAANMDLGPNPLNTLLMNYPTTVANYYINRPVINSASFNGNQLSVNYSYQAPSVEENPPDISQSNVVGFRLDFYINNPGQDGAYTGYSQGRTHLGSFVVDGSETNATHVFTSPVALAAGQNITASATVLWQNIPNPCPTPGLYGDGPPYSVTSCE